MADIRSFKTNLPNLETLFFHIQGIFNRSLDDLPPSLKHLRLGGMFSHPLDQLPHNLMNLRFSSPDFYSHPFDNLPSRLYKLKIKVVKQYKHPFHNLPDSIERLSIACHHASSLIERLPLQLKNLAIHYGNIEKEPLKCPFPTSLQTFKMKKSPNTVLSLPLGITEVDMCKMNDALSNPSMDIDKFNLCHLLISITILSPLPCSIHPLST